MKETTYEGEEQSNSESGDDELFEEFSKMDENKVFLLYYIFSQKWKRKRKNSKV